SRPLHGGPTVPIDPQANAIAIVLKEVDAWVWQLSMATAAGIAGLLVLMILVFIWWRHRQSNRVWQYREETEELSKVLEKANTDLALQRSERRRLESELEKIAEEIEKKVHERTSQLAAAHSQLQKELNDRRHAERLMAQQAKELERSKDVLELHVQARTQELQKLQRRYESILNSAGEGIYGLDLQGRTTFVNPAAAKITGWQVEEMGGK